MRSILQQASDGRTVAVASGPFTARAILADDFKATGKFFTPNAPVAIASLAVPLGVMLSLLPDRRANLYLKAKRSFTFSGGDPAGDVVLDLGALGLDIVKPGTPRAGGPLRGRPDVHAIAYSGAARTGEQDVTAVDYEANTVTVFRPAGVTRIDLYFLTGSGEIAFRAVRPTGSDAAAPQLFKYSLRSLHETNQSSELSAVNFDGLKELPNRWQVQLEVTSPVEIAFDADSRHLINLPGGYTPVKVVDASRFDALAEMALRNGRL